MSSVTKLSRLIHILPWVAIVDGEKKYTDYHNIYLLFFLMSKCPRLFITGGNKDLVGFSTYAYMAAIYGNKQFNMIFNH